MNAREDGPVAFALVRLDLGPADQIVQLGHACLEAGRCFAWPSGSATLVVLAVETAAALRDAIEEARLAGIRAVAFVEPDRALGLTAVCTEPTVERRCFRHHRLWRPQGWNSRRV